MHTKQLIKAALFFALLVCTPLFAEMTVDEVIAKHIKAKGGLENWQKIKTMKLSGGYTGFSIAKTFTQIKSRPNKMYMDHHVGEKRIVLAYDGETAWWENEWYDHTKAAVMGPVDAYVTVQDTHFATPFFNYKEEGHDVQFLGIGDIDGEEGLVLKLKRKTGEEETWYLDKKTFLEFARQSPGSDFGSPLPQRTFFDDFRLVEGVQIPFYVEYEFRTRNRVMTVEKVEVNVEIDEGMFKMPFPKTMLPFKTMAGEWAVKTSIKMHRRAEWDPVDLNSSIREFANNTLFIEEVDVPGFMGPAKLLRTYSFDEFQKKFRMTEFSDATDHTSVLEGVVGEDSFEMTNLDSKTPWQGFGRTFYEKRVLINVDDDHFQMDCYLSSDEGKVWFHYLKQEYTRK